MAHLLGLEDEEREFAKILDHGRHSFEEKLWSGNYYSFDIKPSNKNVIMADQLAGQW